MKFIFFKDKKNIFWNLPLEQHLLILILPIIFSNLSITFKLYQLKLAVYLHWLRFLFCYFFVISFLVWFSIFFYWKFQDIHISELGFSDFCFLTYWNTAASVWIELLNRCFTHFILVEVKKNLTLDEAMEPYLEIYDSFLYSKFL